MNLTETELLKMADLEKRIGIEFKDKSLLKQALIHRSFINEALNGAELSHNERIEFLGDAILELIITEYLYQAYPEYKEGELTSFRAATVRTTSLAITAEKLELGEFVYMSKGEERTGGRYRPYILANTFEAMLGAIYLDQGLETVKAFLHRILVPKIKNIVEQRLDIDHKSKLQEIAQEKTGLTPSYHLLNAVGPDHNKEFTMCVKVGEFVFGEGKGHNKQEAEENAASKAIDAWDSNQAKYFSK
jgi:ribonuclease-3